MGSVISTLFVCVVFRSGIGSVWLSGGSFACTSFFLRVGLALYALMGGEGKFLLNNVLFLINGQCFLKIPLISSENCVTKTSFWGCCVLAFLLRVSFLWVNGVSLMWLIIWLCLYPFV